MNGRIFIVEDDTSIQELIRVALESYGYNVRCFGSGTDLFTVIPADTPDLFLLDIMLPDMDGLEILTKIRKDPLLTNIPVIMLTAKTSEIDKVKGLDLGANDYITKPFGILELMARIRNALRNSPSQLPAESKSDVLQCAGIKMNCAAHSVTLNGARLDLTLKEFNLLKILMQNLDKVVERDRLLNEVWGFDFAGETRTLDMHIRSLRNKLNDDAENPKYIQTIRGVGYKITGTRD